ncbi:hypothetical protein AcW2_007517 [Taiwanofungus camphoratus]|nr:hypothetical protein AcW2_007517 [Antrodia cinnamomea]
MTDRGYFFLLNHLYHPTINLSLSTVQTSIAHYLVHLQPSPTSLAGSLVSSPFFRPFSRARLEVLCTALRHGVHIKVKLLQGEQGSLFARSLKSRATEWVKGILAGLRGGHPMLRLVCSGGLLLGLQDLEGEVHARESRMRRDVEEEVILALAEVIDTYSYLPPSADWSKDYSSDPQDGEEPLSLALLLSSQFVPLVSPNRLQTLPLPTLSNLLISTVESAFHGGAFLHDMPRLLSRCNNSRVMSTSATPFAKTVQAVVSSEAITSMASLSRFCAQAISVLAESRPLYGWLSMERALSRLELIAQNVEADWMTSPLPAVSNEDVIASESRELIAQLWSILKTLLFTVIMISQSILSTVVFVPSPAAASSSSSNVSADVPSAFSLALIVLRTLSHLSFVVSQFGGVISTSASDFPELKRTFYMALDVLSASPSESERFVLDLCDWFDKNTLAPPALVFMKKAYALACIEQLISVLDDVCIRTSVVPLCLPHLSDSSHRETYESAHSVLLAIFASYAQNSREHEDQGRPTLKILPSFAEEAVPFYVQCLIDVCFSHNSPVSPLFLCSRLPCSQNSGEGKLSSNQLCLAFAALVRSASAFGKMTSYSDSRTGGEAMAWYCIETLLNVIRQTSASSVQEPSSSSPHLHHLHLALIATVPSLSLSLLPQVLTELKNIIRDCSSTALVNSGSNPEFRSIVQQRRADLVRALFKEISENVGNEEKEFAMRWWYDNREDLSVTGMDSYRIRDVEDDRSGSSTRLPSRL